MTQRRGPRVFRDGTSQRFRFHRFRLLGRSSAARAPRVSRVALRYPFEPRSAPKHRARPPACIPQQRRVRTIGGEWSGSAVSIAPANRSHRNESSSRKPRIRKNPYRPYPAEAVPAGANIAVPPVYCNPINGPSGNSGATHCSPPGSSRSSQVVAIDATMRVASGSLSPASKYEKYGVYGVNWNSGSQPKHLGSLVTRG